MGTALVVGLLVVMCGGIAYVGDRNGSHSDTERFGGYRRALDSADIPFDPTLVVHGDARPESGMKSAAQLLSLPVPPTAIFCYDDMTAVGAIREIHDRGKRVPDDVSIIGFRPTEFPGEQRLEQADDLAIHVVDRRREKQ